MDVGACLVVVINGGRPDNECEEIFVGKNPRSETKSEFHFPESSVKKICEIISMCVVPEQEMPKSC